MAVYLILVLGATLSPFLLRCEPAPMPQPGSFGLGMLADIAGNALLFLPLGWALRRRPVVLVLGLAAMLSGGIELLQRWTFRTPDVLDVIINTSGALLGHVLGRSAAVTARVERLRPSVLRWWPPVAGVLLLVLVALVLVSQASLRETGFSNWERYPLVLGNELYGKRPWCGVFHEIAIYDRPLETGFTLPAAGPPPWSEGGPVLWLPFREPARARLDGPAGPSPLALEPPADVGFTLETEGLRARGGRWVLPPEVADHVRERLQASDRLSIHADVTPDPTQLKKQCRLVSMSWDPEHRNFTLGQFFHNVIFRVRSPTTGENGARPQVFTRDKLLSGKRRRLLAIYDGSWSRVIADGRCRGEVMLAIYRPERLEVLSRDVGLTILLAPMLAMGAVGPVRRRLRRGGRVLLAAAGAAAWAALLALGTWSHFPGYGPIAVVTGLIAIGAVLSGESRSRTSASSPGVAPPA